MGQSTLELYLVLFILLYFIYLDAVSFTQKSNLTTTNKIITETANSQERVSNNLRVKNNGHQSNHELIKHNNLHQVNKVTGIENLASKFKEPTSSSEAIAMNSICMILKTLQPKK